MKISDLILKGRVEIKNLYPEGEEHFQSKLNTLQTTYKKEFGNKSEGKYYCRSPGRVDMIGGHNDYNGYGVMPFALQRDTAMLFSYNQLQLLRIRNVEQHQYPPIDLPAVTLEQVEQVLSGQPAGRIEYYYYILAGLKSVLGLGGQLLGGIDVVVSGDVPVGCGLSSSSSLVCCAALMGLTLFYSNNNNQQGYSNNNNQQEQSNNNNQQDQFNNNNQQEQSNNNHQQEQFNNNNNNNQQGDNDQQKDSWLKVSTSTLLESVIRAERSLGLNCGGMDQTISLLGKQDQALKIEFEPCLDFQYISLPQQIGFIVADSMQNNIKMDNSYKEYNLRVVECRLALLLLMQQKGLDNHILQLNNLAQLQSYLQVDADYMLAMVSQMPQGALTYQQLDHMLQGQLISLIQDISSYQKVLQFNTEYKPRDRAQHIFTEHKRVTSFINICKQNNNEQQLIALGKILDESQASSRDQYECSSVELDRIVNIGKTAGAIGGRLTGAGWGGCVVLMTIQGQQEQVMQALYHSYYAPKGVQCQQLHSFLVKCSPSQGAYSFNIEQLQ